LIPKPLDDFLLVRCGQYVLEDRRVPGLTNEVVSKAQSQGAMVGAVAHDHQRPMSIPERPHFRGGDLGSVLGAHRDRQTGGRFSPQTNIDMKKQNFKWGISAAKGIVSK
jgi:hypothetical protein